MARSTARRSTRGTARGRDRRPPVAVAHISLTVAAPDQAAAWFETIGMRRIFRGDAVSVLELRGGTHLVLLPARRRASRPRTAPFDLMVDDIDAAHAAWRKDGLKPSRIRRGDIHDSFTLPGPDGWTIDIVSSHASRHPV